MIVTNTTSTQVKKMFIYEISVIILVCWKLGLVGPIQQKIKLPFLFDINNYRYPGQDVPFNIICRFVHYLEKKECIIRFTIKQRISSEHALFFILQHFQQCVMQVSLFYFLKIQFLLSQMGINTLNVKHQLNWN